MTKIQKGYSDFHGYIDFINYCFGMNGTSRAFDTLLPKLYADGKTSADDTYFALDGDKLVGTVLSYPLTLHIGSETLSMRGIGSVATHPRHRGKGIMKSLMEAAIDDMIKDGVALSVLSGRRGRYAHFGYEKCDAMTYYTVNRASLSYREPATDGYSVKKVDRNDTELLDLLHTHMHSRPYYVDRPREELYDILTSWRSTPYAYFQGNRLVGWSVFYASKHQLSEFEVLDPAAIGAILALSVKAFGEITVAVPIYENEKGALIDPYAETVNAISETNFLVLDFEKLLSALFSLKATEVPLCDGSLSVKIEGYRTETLLLAVKNGIPTVSAYHGTPDLTLSLTDAETFFVRAISPKRAAVSPEVASWLPLPLFIHECDNV